MCNGSIVLQAEAGAPLGWASAEAKKMTALKTILISLDIFNWSHEYYISNNNRALTTNSHLNKSQLRITNFQLQRRFSFEKNVCFDFEFTVHFKSDFQPDFEGDPHTVPR